MALIIVIQVSWGQMVGERIDSAAIAGIKEEGLKRSQAMDIISYLTDVYGPRLTGSPEYKKAADWAKSKMLSWGLSNVHYENSAPVAKGWTLKKFSVHMTEPGTTPLTAYPKAWSPGTKGIVKGNVVHLEIKSEDDFEKYRGKLKGAFVLISDSRELKANFEPDGKRLEDSELLQLANADIPRGQQRRGGIPDSAALIRFMQSSRLNTKKLEFVQKEGALVTIEIAAKGDLGNIFVAAAAVPQSIETPFDRRINAFDADAPAIVPQVVMAPEHYNRLVRMVQKNIPVKLEMDFKVEFTKADSTFNIIAEIPGSDLKDEIVMIGAHFDSWHGGTGATDNATGSTVCMEAMRIIKTLGLQPRRTIRIGLWTGEEQGLHGSRTHVEKHFAKREASGGIMGMFGGGGSIQTKPGHEKFSVYFNNDNGTGKVRGVYMQGNEAVRSIFRAWLTPFADLGASTLTLANTSGTDHLSFDAVGLPGFQFIQDPVEYSPRTHHSIMDVFDRVQPDDLKQAATIMAAFAYSAAMRDEKLPRKPLTPPRPAQ